MSDRTQSIDHSHPAEQVPGRRFARSMRGYRRNLVDDAIMRLEGQVADLEQQSVDLREELLDAQHVASEARHDLTRARAELRYWNDRASYVDSEVARARQRALELEQSARERAESIEADAQERSLQLIDRVCTEAGTIMQSAREEAREMFLRFETDVDMSQQKLDKLEQVRVEVAQTMQGALSQFEDAVRELDKVAPAKRIVEALEAPVRRTVPTFGKAKAMEAAKRFDDHVEQSASAVLSSPVPTTFSAEVSDAQHEAVASIELSGTPTGHAQAQAEPVSAPTVPRQHDADDEFAALLLQP